MCSQKWIDLNQKQSPYIVGNYNVDIYEKDGAGFPKATDQVLPPVNAWSSWIRNKPVSAVPTNFNNTQMDFNLAPPGMTKRFILNLNVTNIGSGAINVLPHYLINYCQFMDGNQNVFSTQYADNIYFHKIFQDYRESKQIALAEGISISTYNADTPLAAGASREYFIHIPSFIDSTEQDLNSLNSKLLIRVYFQPNGTDTPASLQLNSCDILTHGFTLAPSLLNEATMRRKNNIWRYRYLEPIRAASQSITNVTTNSQYDIKLTSGAGYSAFLLFVLRPSTLTYANQNVFQVVNNIQLLDENANIVGQMTDSLQMNTLMSSIYFPGDILSVKQNIYLLTFALNPNKSRLGAVTGYYKLTGNELLRVTTEGTITPGSYTFQVYSYEYQIVEQKNGAIQAFRF